MPENTPDKYQQFAALHTAAEGFIIPNPWDAGTARFLEGQGFKALATTSSAASFALGYLDGQASRDLLLLNAQQIAAAVNLPVSADLMNGFGDAPEAVAETITLATEAGLAGGSIEDTTGNANTPIYDKALAKERIAAAVAAARALGRPFTLTARCDGLIEGVCDLKEAIERIQLYQEAGADVLYIPGLDSIEQVRTVQAAVDRPLNVLGGIGALTNAQALLNIGVQRISVGGALHGWAMSSFVDRTASLQAGNLDFAPSKPNVKAFKSYLG